MNGRTFGIDVCAALELDASKVMAIRFGVIDGQTIPTVTITQRLTAPDGARLAAVMRSYSLVLREDQQ